MKRCGRCGTSKPRHNFSSNKSRYDGLQGRCRDCSSQYQKDHPAPAYGHLRGRYGITDERHRELFELAGGSCEICSVPLSRASADRGLRPQTNHCHTTGRVRGILCGPCNRALGLFRDSPGRLESALSYLKGTQDMKFTPSYDVDTLESADLTCDVTFISSDSGACVTLRHEDDGMQIDLPDQWASRQDLKDIIRFLKAVRKANR